MKFYRYFSIVFVWALFSIGCTTTSTSHDSTESRLSVLKSAEARIPGILCSDNNWLSCMGVSSKKECLSTVNTYANACTKASINVSGTEELLDKKGRHKERLAYTLCLFGSHFRATNYKRGTNKYCDGMIKGPESVSGNKKLFRDYIKVGIKAYNNRNYHDALKTFKKAEILYPDDFNVIKYIGQSLLRIRDYPKAIEYFKTASEQESGDHQLYNQIGISYYKLKNILSAKTYFQKAFKTNSYDYYSLAYLSKISCEERNIDECYKYMELFESKYKNKNKDMSAYSSERRLLIQGSLSNFSIYRKRLRR